MADPTPIQQRIDILANTQGAGEVSSALDKLKGQYEEEARQADLSARAAQRKEQQSARLTAKLRELTEQQMRHEQRVKAGTATDAESIRAAERREQQTTRLSRALAIEEDRHEELNRRMREGINVHRTAAASADETGRANAKAGLSVQSLGRAFNTFGVGLTASGGALLALRLFRGELEQLERIQDRVFRKQVTVASAERSLKLNLAGASDDDVDRALEAARTIAEDQSIPLAQATLALADAISARGGNLDEAIGVVNLAAQIRPDKPDEIAGIAGAIGDTQNAIRAQSPEEALGFMLTVGAQSRVANFGQQARNIPAALTGAVAEDFTGAGAGALFSSLSVATADLTGESTRTASINLAAQIDEFFDARSRSEQGADAIFALQNDPALAQAFLADLNLEARALGPARALVSDPTSRIAQDFRRNFNQFGDRSQLEGITRTQLSRLSSGDREANAQTNRDLESANDQLESDNTGFGAVGAIRDQIVPLLKNSGNPALATRLADLKFDLQTFANPEEAYNYLDDLLVQQASLIRSRAISSTSAGVGAPPTITRRPLNTSERQSIETLNRARRTINERRGRETPEQNIEQSGLDFGVTVPGGPFRGSPSSDEVDVPGVRQSNQQSAAPGIMNYGTLYINAGDPLTDDLDGRDRLG